MMTTEKALFELGRVVATCGAMHALQRNHANAQSLLDRHSRGDWGAVETEDAETNDRALESGAQLLSVYELPDQTQLWVITDAVNAEGNRATTTLLLPDDY